jgi:exodeoxyribonuclease V beta subunit
MQRFDCLSRECPLFGAHLLEASAGTGKTFSIEHIFVRLILESVELEQILAVTFTKAAARELKARIRTNLEKAFALLQKGEATWDYLEPYLGSQEAIRSLADALALFDRCQIFTIHGFCYRALQEFAFEAKVGTLSNPDEGRKVPERLKQAALDFLENGIPSTLLCPEQLTLLFKEFESVDEIVNRLLRLDEVLPSDSFLDLSAKCKAALHRWNLREAELLEDFRTLQKNYKVQKGNFEKQIQALANPERFPDLLKERGSLFDFLDPSNRKVKAQEPTELHYPGFFEWARIHIAPLTQQKVFPVLQAAWNPIAKKILADADHLDPDEILLQMKKAVENASFADLIHGKYAAAIIDEFQDTDEIQWEIFQKLFIEKPMRALYLVGDPKQSIYRFRKADVYTYLKARDFLGEANLYQLDTNFRSSKPLISALNTLFARDWLRLPKVSRTLPYHPVKAGAKIDSQFPDEKGALHFFIAEGEPNLLFDQAFLPFAVQEIERLQLKHCALLVKDRYQAQRALDLLQARGIPAVAKSHTPLGQTLAFQAVRELFEAILSPRDVSLEKIVMAGPFGRSDLSLFDYKILLEERGLVPLARELDLDPDAMQIFELLFAWEREEGFSFEGLKRKLKVIESLDAEEGGRRRMEVNDEAVQIMTLHISKGLEFDIVFALGLASRTPKAEEGEELDAEKLRQLYVAMTRAKKRLYVPFALGKKEADAGTHSPLELFSRHFEGPLLEHLKKFSATESITMEEIPSPLVLQQTTFSLPSFKESMRPSPRSFAPSYLSSFTMLAKTQESQVTWTAPEPGVFTLQTMPRGPETGIAIHQIFETLFMRKIWRDSSAVTLFIAEQLRHSPLAPWQEAIQTMVKETLTQPLVADGVFFTLQDPDQFQVEMEFVFSSSPDYIKGFIDLVFFYQERIYFLDWKTNWLEQYDQAHLEKAMQAHDYPLQAALYKEAIHRHFKAEFGGAFYIFVRGGAVYHVR